MDVTALKLIIAIKTKYIWLIELQANSVLLNNLSLKQVDV